MGADGVSTARLVGRVLRAAGIDAVYGRPFGELGVVPVDAPDVAGLLADAHPRVHGRPAAVHMGDGLFRVGAAGSTNAPGAAPSVALAGTPEPLLIASIDDLMASVVPLVGAVRGGSAAVRVELEPDAPAPDVVPPLPEPVDRWIDVDAGLVGVLEAATAPVMLAGPGVVWSRAVPGLHALAAAANLGVLNTWGAKGVFDWRSRHHLATAGLQARDFELGGLTDADLIVAAGVDPGEAADERWRQFAPVAELPPNALDPLSERWSRRPEPIVVPPLRSRLALVTQEGWASTATPLAPSRVTLAYGRAFGAGGLVAADPGVAGYWVARTFPTTELGGVLVPSAASHGFAVACATVARLPSPARPVLAVVDGPVRDIVAAALAAAAHLGVDVPVEVWEPDGRALDADAHAARLDALVNGDRAVTASLATDPRQLARMVDAVGEVIAWGGIDAPG